MRATTLQNVNIYLPKEKMWLSGISESVDSARGTFAFSGLWNMSGPKSVCVCVCVTLRSNLLIETIISETYVNADLGYTCKPVFVCVLG